MAGKSNLIVIRFAALLAALAIFATAAHAQAVNPRGGSPDPTSIKGIIDKVKRGVVAISPHDATSVIGIETGSIGSGFIVDKDGWFVTNVHVLTGSSYAEVSLWDNSIYRGELVAVDPGIDIAVGRLIGIPADKIFPVAWGDSDKVEPGELALAMGQPGDQTQINVDPSDPMSTFGLRQTATVRVVSGKDTTLEFPLMLYQYNMNTGFQFGSQYGTNFTYSIRMQTGIAGGNSGGPLFNNRGEVIGINFFGGSGGITQTHNSAIPGNLAKEFYFSVKKMYKEGLPLIRHQSRPWLGLDVCMPAHVNGPDKYLEFIERYRPKDKIVVYGVRRDSPAWFAGFVKNDEILQVNGKKFGSPEELRFFVLNLPIDEELIFTVKRGVIVSHIRVKTDVKRGYDSEFSI